jgi:hypothetical protein
LQRRLFDGEGGTERKQNSTATRGIDCGGAPPPIPSGGLLQGGRTRRRSPHPVPRRRGWRRRARASGAKRACLGGSWERGESLRLIRGGLYRPERRGRGRPEARRCGGPGRVRRATLGTAALLACWEGCRLGCGGLWVGSGASMAVGNVQQAGKKRGGGPGCCLLFSSLSHGSGRGRGHWARPWHRPGAWRQGLGKQVQ